MSVCVSLPSNSYVESLTPKWFWRWGPFGRQSGRWGCHDRISALMRDAGETRSAPRLNHEKVPNKPGREPSTECSRAGALSSEVPGSRTVRNKFLLLDHLCLPKPVVFHCGNVSVAPWLPVYRISRNVLRLNCWARRKLGGEARVCYTRPGKEGPWSVPELRHEESKSNGRNLLMRTDDL